MSAVGSLNRVSRLGLAALTLAGCASSAQVYEHFEPLRAKVRTEAEEVAARMKPEHFQRCRELLAGRDLLQTECRATGDFQLNLGMSCHAQDAGSMLFGRDYKVAVYQVGNEKVGTGLNMRGHFAACEVRLLRNGTIEVRNGANNLKAHVSSPCHLV